MLSALISTYSGKRFGNRVADHLGIHRGLYHSAMEEGGCVMHLLKLNELKRQNSDLDEVAYHSSKFLFPGLTAIEARFGKQDLIDDAVLKLSKFVDDYESRINPADTDTNAAADENVIVSSEFSSGRYELLYKIELVQKMANKEYVSKETYSNRSDDLGFLKSMALMKKMGGVEVTLRDRETGKSIVID